MKIGFQEKNIKNIFVHYCNYYLIGFDFANLLFSKEEDLYFTLHFREARQFNLKFLCVCVASVS